jgi:hypothetical protein
MKVNKLKILKVLDKPITKAVHDIEASYQAQFDNVVRETVAQITKKLLAL